MKFNKNALKRCLKEGQNIEQYVDRQVGNTTSIIFKMLSTAIDNPNMIVRAYDHIPFNRVRQNEMMDKIAHYINVLDLSGMEVCRTSSSIKYTSVIDLTEEEYSMLCTTSPRTIQILAGVLS